LEEWVKEGQDPEDAVFTEESYQAFLKTKKHIVNNRLRGDNVSFFEAMLSDEADFTKGKKGKELVRFLQDMGEER
jgi:hypothetical protein